MTQTQGIIFCLTYILGLLSTAVPWGSYGVLLLLLVLAIIIHFRLGSNKKLLSSLWRIEAKPQVWLIAGLIGFLASLYFQARIPQPAVNDISRFVLSAESGKQQLVSVKGKVASKPRLTRSQRGQFWLEVNALEQSRNTPVEVTGKLYVTVPLLQTTGIYPSQAIAVTGTLYKPKPAANPNGFDFKIFLEREGTFAGLSGREVQFPKPEKQPQWGWWLINQRIVRSQVRWLGSPVGPLVSSMVLGSKAVDLPYDIRDLFVRVGLAHALAASGFQTSLILGLVLALTRRLSPALQVGCGTGALAIFLCLTGLQPSVLRAVIMGFGVLIALAMRRKVKLLGSLLIAATLLLIFNPLWIWDLGFQLSFLATLGLIVTVPPLIKYLDWMPVAIASLIAVPLAASIWTLPLQLHIFGVVPLYSLIVNILTTPLISIISIGGIISAIAGLILPVAGSALAFLLYYPTYLLIEVAQFFSQLPGNSFAVGSISIWQLLAIYTLLILAWFQSWWQRRWWLAGFLVTVLVLVPAWHSSVKVSRVTVLAGGLEPVIVIQDQGKVLLINSGDGDTARFTILPFLQQQGINQIHLAIATNFQTGSNSGWLEIVQRLAVKNFYEYINKVDNLQISRAIQAHLRNYQLLSSEQNVKDNFLSAQLIDAQVQILKLQIKGKTWLLFGNLELDQQKQLASTQKLPPAEIILWTGELLATELLTAIKPQVAIASSAALNSNTISQLHLGKTQVFLTGRDGAIQWTPNGKFEATIEVPENNASLF